MIERALRKKDKQLKPYRQRRMRTALLLDLLDFQLVNEVVAARAFGVAVRRYKPGFITKVWIVRSTTRRFWIMPLNLGRRVHRGSDRKFPGFMNYFRRSRAPEGLFGRG